MHWERGYRSHGLWDGLRRVAVVSLTAARFGPTEYNWRIDSWWHNEPSRPAPNLRAAKRAVEQELGVTNRE